MEAKWQHLFEHKDTWVDQRGSKVGKQPDFRSRSDGRRALWLDSRGLPAWVPERVTADFGVRLAPPLATPGYQAAAGRGLTSAAPSGACLPLR